MLDEKQIETRKEYDYGHTDENENDIEKAKNTREVLGTRTDDI